MMLSENIRHDPSQGSMSVIFCKKKFHCRLDDSTKIRPIKNMAIVYAKN